MGRMKRIDEDVVLYRRPFCIMEAEELIYTVFKELNCEVLETYVNPFAGTHTIVVQMHVTGTVYKAHISFRFERGKLRLCCIEKEIHI